MTATALDYIGPHRIVTEACLYVTAPRNQRRSRAVTRGEPDKGRILDELCTTTGWHRNCARKALKAALRPKLVKPRSPRALKYGANFVAALVFCWALLRADDVRRVEAVATAATRTIGLTTSRGHTELMLTAEGLIVIEVNGRSGGAVYELMKLSTDTTGLTPLNCSKRA